MTLGSVSARIPDHLKKEAEKRINAILNDSNTDKKDRLIEAHKIATAYTDNKSAAKS